MRALSAVLAVTAAFCLSGLEAMAAKPSSRTHESVMPPSRLAPSVDTAAISAAWNGFQSRHTAPWRISWDDNSRLPRMLTGVTARSYGRDPEAAARAFVGENRSLFGLLDQDHGVRVIDVRNTRSQQRVTLQQHVRNVDVYEGTIVVVIDGEGRIRHVANSAWPVSGLDMSSDIGPDAARATVEGRFGTSALTYANELRRVVYPSGNGHLAYLAVAIIDGDPAPWRVVIDARTGEIIEERRLVNEEKDETRQTTVEDAEPRALDPADACDREWIEWDPNNQVTLTLFPPTTTLHYSVRVQVGGFTPCCYCVQQPASIYAAGVKLLPGIKYTISAPAWFIATNGSYNATYGNTDVFFVNVNSTNFYWNLGQVPNVQHFCGNSTDTTGTVLPGKTWTAGGFNYSGCNPCSQNNGFGGPIQIEYFEPDPTKDVYLSVGMQRFWQFDKSQGDFTIHIRAKSYIFSPNPVTTKNTTYTDQDDEHTHIPTDAYKAVNLANLTTPTPGNPWKLKGSYAEIAEREGPAKTYPTVELPQIGFPFLRRCDPFEAVMCYHHVTQNQLYIQSLGFTDVNNRVHEIDPHGLGGQDNSHYVGNPIGGGFLAFGEGGVDDAEDADVILHEYGHSIQDNQTTGVYFGSGDNDFGDETGAMGEGFGDYWASSAFKAASEASGFPAAVWAEWDAQDANGLRRVDGSKIYPVDMADEVHDDGEIWSRTLWDLLQLLGREDSDVLVLESHFLVPEDPTFSDGAKAILAADELENGGANEDAIIDIYLDRGIFREVSVVAPGTTWVSMEDVRGDASGIGSFDRVYSWGDSVTLTAPSSHLGKPFLNWSVDGVDGQSADTTATVIMDHTPASHVAIAVYDTLLTAIGRDTPLALELHPNRPNPFNPTTTIPFGVPEDMEVEIVLFDVAGRLVRTLQRGRMNPGFHEVSWDGRDSAGEVVGSGVYLCRLRAGSTVITRKMVLLK